MIADSHLKACDLDEGDLIWRPHLNHPNGIQKILIMEIEGVPNYGGLLIKGWDATTQRIHRIRCVEESVLNW